MRRGRGTPWRTPMRSSYCCSEPSRKHSRGAETGDGGGRGTGSGSGMAIACLDGSVVEVVSEGFFSVREARFMIVDGLAVLPLTCCFPL